MAVNENDRVSTRRLKEFWQTAKPWIQNLVSGAIDTSEETMSSTMDTKILAAKPDYTKPNIDGQIGAGFGYNDMVGNYKSSSEYIGFSSLETYFSSVATESPFMGNALIGKQAAYLFSFYGGSSANNNDMIRFSETFLKGFEGKLVAFPKDMSNDANFTSYVDFINDLDNFKSTYIEAEACLLSPVWTVGENTYQTKLYKRSGNYSQFAYSLSVNGGPFEEQTPASGDGLAWCASFNNMPLDIGSCDVADGSVTTSKLAASSVTKAKLANGSLSYDKFDNNTYLFIPQCQRESSQEWSSEVHYQRSKSDNKIVFCGFSLYGIYDNSNLLNHITEHLNENNVVDGFALHITNTYHFSSSWKYLTSNFNIFGWCYLKTDIGLYSTPIIIIRSNEYNVIVRYMDPAFSQHLSEANPLLIASCAYHPEFATS